MNQRVQRILLSVWRHPLVRQMALVAAAEDLLPVYLVGGFLRDALLGRPPTLDIDLVSAAPPSLAAALQQRFVGKVVPLAADVRRVVFLLKGERVQVDIAPLFGGTIIQDLGRRDFTINALGISLGEEPPRLVDPTSGLRDLRERRVRMTDRRVLIEDPLRLLRAVRLAARLDFDIEETTAQAIRHQASLVRKAAPERIREEFFEILDSPGSGRWLAAMADLGLLEALLPELQVIRGCLQGRPHRLDVFHHSLETVRSLDRILLRLPRLLPEEGPSLIESLRAEVEGGIRRQALLRFTALLHDVGKPDTRSAEGDQVRFLGHAERGAAIVRGISRRLRIGSRASATTVALVRNHLRPLFLQQAEPISPRAQYRFWRDLGVLAADCLLLSLADIRATWLNEGRAFRNHLRFVRDMFAFYRERMMTREEPGKPGRLLDGRELMARLELRPGPFVGFLLERLEEEASLGSFRTKAEALRYLKRHLPALREEFVRARQP
jgi:poly(A) polymerase